MCLPGRCILLPPRLAFLSGPSGACRTDHTGRLSCERRTGHGVRRRFHHPVREQTGRDASPDQRPRDSGHRRTDGGRSAPSLDPAGNDGLQAGVGIDCEEPWPAPGALEILRAGPGSRTSGSRTIDVPCPWRAENAVARTRRCGVPWACFRGRIRRAAVSDLAEGREVRVDFHARHPDDRRVRLVAWETDAEQRDVAFLPGSACAGSGNAPWRLQVSSAFGSERALRKLTDAAHARGVQILLWTSPGHLSNSSPLLVQHPLADRSPAGIVSERSRRWQKPCWQRRT